SAAGAVRHAALVRHAQALFGGLSGSGPTEDAKPARYVGGSRISEKPFEQCHLLVGFPSPTYRDDNYVAAQVLSGRFGGGMSSGSIRKGREKRGLRYSIYWTSWGLRDAGLCGIHAATGTRLMRELIEVIGVELRRAAATLPGASELGRARAQLKAGLLMSLES